MKVLHVVPTYWPAVRYGGPIYSVHGLCAALATKSLDINVITTSVDGRIDTDVEHGKVCFKDDVKIFYYQSQHLRRIYYSPQLRQALKGNMKKFDIVHLHSIFLYPTNIAARLAVKYKIPYVVSPRGMLEKALIKNKSTIAKSIWLKLFEKKTLEQADLIHLTSDREQQKLSEFNYNFPKTVVIPNGVDLDSLNGIQNLNKASVFQVLFIGRLSWKKQIGKLIESLTLLDFSVKLIIAGNDEEKYIPYLKRLIDNLRINEKDHINIDFVGAQYGDKKKQLFITSNVMVLPSLSENFGNTVIESLAMGCPVIVTPEVGASEVVRKSDSGLITDGTAEDIAKKIGYLKQNPEMAKQMSQNGVDEIKKNYLWSIVADSMIDAYQGLLV